MKKRVIFDVGLMVGILSLLITMSSLWLQMEGIKEDNVYQKTQSIQSSQQIALLHQQDDHLFQQMDILSQQLNVQVKIATVQAEVATVQADGGSSTIYATIQAKEVKLEKTKVALATKSAKLQSTPDLTQSPEQFIHRYYEEINNRHYNITWNWLTGSYQKRSETFDRYVEWWDTIEKVELKDVTVLEPLTANESRIKATLRYYRKDGTVVESPKIFLLVTDSRGRWRINETE